MSYNIIIYPIKIEDDEQCLLFFMGYEYSSGIFSGAQVVLKVVLFIEFLFHKPLVAIVVPQQIERLFSRKVDDTRHSKNKRTMNSTNDLQIRSQRKLRRLAINKNIVYDCSILFMSAKQCEALARKQLRSQLQNAKRKNESPEKREIRLRKQREINNRNRQVDGWQEYQQAYHTIRTIRLNKSN